jgi:hypothetical protein
VQNFFVFGTLMYPRILEALLGAVPEMLDATLSGYRRCSIDVPGRAAKGPALVPSSTDKVRGKILCGLVPHQTKIIDLFEDAASGYRRVRGQAQPKAGRLMDVDFYVATEQLRDYLSDDDWSETEFENQYYDMYVTERVPGLLKKWNASGLI